MASFPPSVNEKLIGRSRTIGELLAPASPFDKKCGRENWTVVFAPDGSYFAWSQGHRIVRLVPWSQCLNNFSLHGVKNFANISHSRLSRQNSSDDQKSKLREHVIDCGDIVWSLAFGSSVPEKQSRCVNIEWHRFTFGQDQLLLATGLSNGRIKIWDVYTGKLLLNLMDHTEVVRDLTFAPDGSLVLVSASRDKTLRVWDLKDDGNMVKVLRGHPNWVYSCAFSPDSAVLCSVGASKTVVAAIGVIEGKLAPLRQAHKGVSWAESVASLATRLGTNFTLGRSNPCIRLQGVLEALILYKLKPNPGLLKVQRHVHRAKPCWYGSLLVGGDLHFKIWHIAILVLLWDMDKYSLIRKLEGHHNDVVACEFSPDGALLATASHDTRVYVWDPYTGAILREFGHLFPPPTPIFAGGANDRWVRSVSFSHDGLHIASLADDKMVRFWRIDEDHPVQVAPLHNGLCCAFSTDGSVLAAGTQDGSVCFWATPKHVPSLQHLCRLAIRRVMPTSQVASLPIPSTMVAFLSYRT